MCEGGPRPVSRLTPLCRLLNTAVALPKSSSMSCSLFGVCHGILDDPGSGASTEIISRVSHYTGINITVVCLDTVVEEGSLLVTRNIVQVEELDFSQRNNDLKISLGNMKSGDKSQVHLDISVISFHVISLSQCLLPFHKSKCPVWTCLSVVMR